MECLAPHGKEMDGEDGQTGEENEFCNMGVSDMAGQ